MVSHAWNPHTWEAKKREYLVCVLVSTVSSKNKETNQEGTREKECLIFIATLLWKCSTSEWRSGHRFHDWFWASILSSPDVAETAACALDVLRQPPVTTNSRSRPSSFLVRSLRLKGWKVITISTWNRGRARSEPPYPPIQDLPTMVMQPCLVMFWSTAEFRNIIRGWYLPSEKTCLLERVKND